VTLQKILCHRHNHGLIVKKRKGEKPLILFYWHYFYIRHVGPHPRYLVVSLIPRLTKNGSFAMPYIIGIATIKAIIKSNRIFFRFCTQSSPCPFTYFCKIIFTKSSHKILISKIIIKNTQKIKLIFYNLRISCMS